jgi:hypothetical protein
VVVVRTVNNLTTSSFVFVECKLLVELIVIIKMKGEQKMSEEKKKIINAHKDLAAFSGKTLLNEYTKSIPTHIFLGMMVQIEDAFYIGLFKQPGLIQPFFKLEVEDDVPSIADNRIILVQADIRKEKDNDRVSIKVAEKISIEVSRSLTKLFEEGGLENMCNHIYVDVMAYIGVNKDKIDPKFIKLLERANYI